MENQPLSINEACEASGLGRASIYKAMKSGDLVARKFGKRTFILKDDLQEFIDNLPLYNDRKPRVEKGGE